MSEQTTENRYAEPTDEDRIAFARYNHALWPSKRVQCPDCHLFSAHPWEKTYGTQDGTFWEWGGVCKTHGAWSDGS